MDVQLDAVHTVYLFGVAAIVLSMALRANVVVPAIIATFAVAATYSGSLIAATISVFNGSLVAAKELFSIFLVIALMTSLLNALRALGAGPADGAALPARHDQRACRLPGRRRRHLRHLAVLLADAGGAAGGRHACCRPRSSPACRRSAR